MKNWILAGMLVAATALVACGDDTEDSSTGGSTTTSSSTSSSTTSSGTTSSTTSSTTGTGATCDEEADCDACTSCALEGDCMDEFATCSGNAECTALLTCAQQCDADCANDADPQACSDECVSGANNPDSCVAMHPDGVMDILGLQSCVYEQQCPMTCGG